MCSSSSTIRITSPAMRHDTLDRSNCDGFHFVARSDSCLATDAASGLRIAHTVLGESMVAEHADAEEYRESTGEFDDGAELQTLAARFGD